MMTCRIFAFAALAAFLPASAYKHKFRMKICGGSGRGGEFGFFCSPWQSKASNGGCHWQYKDCDVGVVFFFGVRSLHDVAKQMCWFNTFFFLLSFPNIVDLIDTSY